MDSPLQRFLHLLGADVSRERLIDALYVVRAPRHLIGIIPAMRQFRDWRHTYDALGACPEIEGYAEALALLDRIADLDTTDAQLSGRVTAHRESVWTPLRPLTGDSVICELLLIQSGDGVDRSDFEHASAWLLWQAQRFHQKWVRRSSYEDYLLSNSERLKDGLLGGRLYNAYLALRRLAVGTAEARAQLKALGELTREFSDAQSLFLTMLVRMAHLCTGRSAPAVLRRRVRQTMQITDPALDALIDRAKRSVPRAYARLLVAIWDSTRLRWSESRMSAVRSVDTRAVTRPKIRRGQRLTEVLLAADEDDVHAATVVEIFPDDGAPTRGSRTRDADDDDPDQPAEQPEVSFVLATGDDLLKGYYAAKGIQNAIEYDNAQLTWSKWTLSRAAIRAVDHLVTHGARADEVSLDTEARLAIGLSLLTGRALEEVARPAIMEDAVTFKEHVSVAISRTDHRLHVRAGQPDLRQPPSASAPFCRPRSQTLSLPLPPAWRPLVQAIGTSRPRSRSITTHARKLLDQLPPELHVTAKGLRGALVRALNAHTRGDLGALAALTAGAEANARNIIHYASYERRQMDTWWRQAAEALVGTLPAHLAESTDSWVGAQHAFDVDALTAYFAEIQHRLRTAEARQDWPRAFNLMTLYLSYWLGLGLAQRRTLDPVPRILLMDGWALVMDKHRADRSTDRLVPVTRALKAQIDAYVALASELAVIVPALDPLVVTEQGTEIRLQYIRPSRARGQKDVVAYRPKYQEQDEQLTALPANWGRKVVRSLSAHLPGRFRDAELGHWVRGRHAWDATSTFDVSRFQDAWLDLHETLEHRLGFEVLQVAGCTRAPRSLALLPAAPMAGRNEDRRSPPPPDPQPVPDAEELLRSHTGDLFDTFTQATDAHRPAVALELARRVMRGYTDAPLEHKRAVAETLCQYLRMQWKLPIFAMKPRPLFAHKVLLDGGTLQTLAYLEAHVFPAFERDLACLPPRLPASDHTLTREQDQVELGRLVMLAIWRLGLARWGLIDAWLRAMQGGAPILAQGPNRYMVLRVKAEGTRDSMQRTVFLDAFSAAYLTIERHYIKSSLLDPLCAVPSVSHRRSRAERCLQSYLKHLGAGDHRVSMAAMTGAAVQYLMMHGAPIIGAYARGALDTEDLGDAELRRLGGLVPARRSGAGKGEGLPATRAPPLGEDELPRDILERSPIMKALGRHRSPYKSEWKRLIRAYKPATPVEALLCGFCLWLLDAQTHEKKLNAHHKRHVINRVKVIAYAMLGFAGDTSDSRRIDEDTLVQLQEISRDQFPDRLQHGAWFQFHRFLADAGADHAGMTIGNIGAAPERAVSAKILSGAELHQLHGRLLSATSGIGNAALRTSAQRHVELMATFGLRRGESAHLRTVDVQEDLCRVQAYGEHTLKTAWADRVLPVAFADDGTRAWIDAATEHGREKLIDPDAATSADPNNFYDALSRLIKTVTQDQSMGSHHLRHTLVSRLVLTLLWTPAGLDGLRDACPWMEELKISDARMQALLGTEGDAGQGMRAVSALVGHSHPTTTVRHYAHVLCVALHGVLHTRDGLDMSRSFEHRLGGKATMHRWMARIRTQHAGQAHTMQRTLCHRALRDRIEQRLKDAGIDRDETPLAPMPDMASPAGDHPTAEGIDFDRIELVDRSLRDGHLLVPENEVAIYRAGLERLTRLRTGKVGSKMPRHVLSAFDAARHLPPALAAGSATVAAVRLCIWLKALRTDREDDFLWLMDKWTHATERERGRMRLSGTSEITRAKSLEDAIHVKIRVKHFKGSNRDKKRDAKPVPRMRIMCLDARGKAITRNILAVRWVMTYVTAKWGRNT